MAKHTNSNKGLSLVEILGAIAVLATVATVSVISIKDTVQAGQKASAQKEIQNLNAALESFKSAGGVILEDATFAEAADALQRGVDLAGSEYAPLVSIPEADLTIAGETYSLAYNPEDGFSYVNDEAGDLIGGSGSPLVGAGSFGAGAGYAPGATPVTPENVNAALAALASSTPGTPEYDAILADLAVALASGDLSAEDTSAVTNAALSEGLYYDGALGWTGSPNYKDFMALYNNNGAYEFLETKANEFGLNSVEELVAMSSFGSPRSIDEVAYTMGYSFPDKEYALNLLPAERATLFLALDEEAAKKLVNWMPQGYNEEGIRTLLLDQLPADKIATALNLRSESEGFAFFDLSGLDLTGFDTAGKDLQWVNFAGSNITAEQLNATTNIGGANLSQVNLTGFDVNARQEAMEAWTSGYVYEGRGLRDVNFSGTNIAIAELVKSGNLRGINLSGTGITRAALEQALIDAGKDPSGQSHDVSTITF